MVAANARTPLCLTLTGGQVHDARAATCLLEKLHDLGCEPLIMDRAYEGDALREEGKEMGIDPVVPPKKNRKNPWKYDKKLYKRRNEIERLFLLLKHFR